ncbi:MAG: AAA family ATPase [Candidatus Promineifilaceae bacterium]|jgi:class 3 adenylate cyclase/tetratricopeptide (TPR) repeat protein
MKSFSAFIPIDRRIALIRGEDLPDRTQGSALFADISGFTILTSAMAREYGPQRGAEEMAGWLNRVFGALIECVHNQMGSVVTFNGDAITCWFDDQPIGQPDSSRAAALRAVACAFAMQKTIDQFRSIRLPSDTVTSLHIKVAVGAGTIRRFEIGRPELQRIDVLAGGLLNRIAESESLISQDEVIVGEEIVIQLGSYLEVEQWRSHGNGQRYAVVKDLTKSVPESPWVEIPDLTNDVTSEWLCLPVYERLNMAQGAFLAELRPSVVVLYLSFSGFDYDHDDNVRGLLDRFISSVQLVLSRYEGFLLQLSVGDKGSYLLATFGTIRAHEDDPVRALEAAIDLQELPPDLMFVKELKIGITLGTLYAGAFGGSTRQTYNVLGSEANIGARLMSYAKPGQIVVSSQMVDAASSRYNFDELGMVLLKGLAKPRQLFLLTGKLDREPQSEQITLLSTPIVGRSKEQATLAASLASLQEGKSTFIIIEGDPGIGKSNLTMAFLEQARNTSLPILLGAGDSIDQGTPYYAWRPIFQTIFDIGEATDQARYQDKMITKLPDDPEIRQLAPLLNAVLPANFPDNELTEKMAGEARANSTRNLLVNLLATTLEQSGGLILILEDAHWLDSASWALAAQVHQLLSPVLLLIVTRPMVEEGIQTKEADKLLADQDAERINLSSLSSEEILFLIESRLGVHNLPQPIADLVLNQGEGHPFYSEEIAYALRDTGYLLIEGDQARLADASATLQDIDFPATIQGVITSRIDQLDVSEQLTLKVASVIGRLFAFHVLNSIYPEQSIIPALPNHLQNLERLDIINLEALEPDLAYIFKQIITQEVVYNLMTFSQRQWLHRSAAEWYERRYTEDLSPFYPLLAYHWRRAEEPARAIDYLEKAGRQALRDNANKEAIDFFTEIKEVASTSGLKVPALRQATWTRQIADGYLGLGEILTAQTFYEEAAKLLDQPIPASNIRLAAAFLGQLTMQSLHRLWPSRYLDQQKGADILLEAAHAYQGIGFTHYVSNETIPFLHANVKALNLAELVGLSRPLAEGYATLSVIASLLPGDRLSELYASMAMNAAEKLNDPSIFGNVMIRIAVYHSGMAHWKRAEAAADQAIANYTSINDLRGWGDSVNVQLYTYYYTARFIDCLNLGQELYQAARRNENIQHQAWGLWMSARSLIRLGRYDEAVRNLEHAQPANALEVAHISGSMALVYWHLSQAQEALDAINKVDISVAAASPGFATLSAIADIADFYLLAWESILKNPEEYSAFDSSLLVEIQTGARQSCKIIQGFSRIFPIGKPAISLYQGKLYWLEEKRDKAFKAWQKSIDYAGRLNMPYELARAHYELGRHLAHGNPQQQTHLQLAAEGFELLGASGDMAQVLASQESG